SAAAMLALVACIALTTRQLPYWAGTVPLFQHAAAVTRNNLMAHSVLGSLWMQDRRDEAVAELSETTRICDTTHGSPTICARAHYNIGLMLAHRGDASSAEQHYRAAL